MFLGEFSHIIDEKGRLTLPAKYRTDLGHGVVVTRGVDKCLFIFTAAEFQRLAGQIGQLPMTLSEARELSRHFFPAPRMWNWTNRAASSSRRTCAITPGSTAK